MRVLCGAFMAIKIIHRTQGESIDGDAVMANFGGEGAHIAKRRRFRARVMERPMARPKRWDSDVVIMIRP